ncbi:MAG: hypothetical protein Ta2F_16650 [Termitinemataceae bacterium]|nr:MAG: hypothetical protein Ta2F_16650 [Termitinemataceae bacterium]
MKDYSAFKDVCLRFKKLTQDIQKQVPQLHGILQNIVTTRSGPQYNIVNSVVYNRSLDNITEDDHIKLIIIGDNPGRREQESSLYLIGPSGKIAEGFFKKEKSLQIDFRKNTIILNKTPVHTPRTADLKEVIKSDAIKSDIKNIIESSQKEMANLLSCFYATLGVPIWITGYSEMKHNGIFETYMLQLQTLIAEGILKKEDIFIYRHFSMNQFTIDLNKQKKQNETVKTALNRIGAAYRDRILSV